MRQYLIFLLFIFLVGGCQSRYIELDDKWRPLRRIEERGSLPFVSDGVITTIGDTLYIKDHEEYLNNHPVGSKEFIAQITHEWVHSKRQHDYGVTQWLMRYSFDKKFRLEEEKIAFYVELKYMMANNMPIDYNSIAIFMGKNYFGMITYIDALTWLNEVSNDRWKPDDEEILSKIPVKIEEINRVK